MNTKLTQTISLHAPYKVRELGEPTQEEWDALLRDCPGGGHVLQSYTWGEFKREQGWRPLRLALYRDGEIAGAGQFLLRSTWPVPGKLMYATKGPWLPWNDEEGVRAFFAGVADVARREGVHTVKVEPEILSEQEDVKALLGSVGFRKARYDLNFDATILVDLGLPSEKEILDRMSGSSKKGKTTRYNINLASRRGVEVYEPSDFEWAFETLHGWLESLSQSKKGFSARRPRGYRYDMMRRMYEAGRGHFLFAAHEGEALSSSYIFDFGEKLWFMYNASSGEKRKLQANYLLQWEILRRARERGITHAYFVGVPKRGERTKDHPYYGSYEFKRGFGGEVIEFVGCMDLAIAPLRAAAWYQLEPLYYRAYARARNNLFY